jgi:hypothetical protein
MSSGFAIIIRATHSYPAPFDAMTRVSLLNCFVIIRSI